MYKKRGLYMQKAFTVFMFHPHAMRNASKCTYNIVVTVCSFRYRLHGWKIHLIMEAHLELKLRIWIVAAEELKLTERHSMAKDALKREESIRTQHINFLKQTHETQIEIKNALVRNLEDIIDEQESKIFELESQNAGIAGSFYG
uniref:Uncharacterized protein n=1 Tax=Romanomermis culicivorax TaxID=13658 RepID=A0A915K2J8_ROMCU